MSLPDPLSLDPDSRTGMIPIAKASASLVALLRQARAAHGPVALTQPARPSPVIIDRDLFASLHESAAAQAAAER